MLLAGRQIQGVQLLPPERFSKIQLTPAERDALTSQIAMSKTGRGGRRTLPFAFTEHGALMAANILNSLRAVAMSVYIMPLIIAVNMLLHTEAGDTFTFAEIADWLREAGFANPRMLEAPAPSPLILATRP